VIYVTYVGDEAVVEIPFLEAKKSPLLFERGPKNGLV
jgi:hypothetical protein